jgi:hypothetical protein
MQSATTSAAPAAAVKRLPLDEPMPLRRSLVVAPPPVGLARSRPQPSVPAPAAPPATRTSPHASSGSSSAPGSATGSNRSALYAAAAALFAAPGSGAAPGTAAAAEPRGDASGPADLRRFVDGLSGPQSGGAPMSENLPALRRLQAPVAVNPAGTVAAVAGGPGEAASISSRQLEQLVDLVVERIEERVVDELERRGRRTGGF